MIGHIGCDHFTIRTPCAEKMASKWLRDGEKAVCGMDMGPVHLAYCILAYRTTTVDDTHSHKRKFDEKLEEMKPTYRVVSMRLINLERNCVYGAYDAPPNFKCWATARQNLPPLPTFSEEESKSKTKKPQLKAFIFRAIYDQLRQWECFRELGPECPVFIEQQVDHLDRNRELPINFALSKSHVAAIEAIDQADGHAFGARPISFPAKKEGVSRGKSYSKDKAHKEASIQVMKDDLHLQKDEDALKFIAILERLGWKLDDPADARGIAKQQAHLALLDLVRQKVAQRKAACTNV